MRRLAEPCRRPTRPLHRTRPAPPSSQVRYLSRAGLAGERRAVGRPNKQLGVTVTSIIRNPSPCGANVPG
jgi:hypothetical protein